MVGRAPATVKLPPSTAARTWVNQPTTHTRPKRSSPHPRNDVTHAQSKRPYPRGSPQHSEPGGEGGYSERHTQKTVCSALINTHQEAKRNRKFVLKEKKNPHTSSEKENSAEHSCVSRTVLLATSHAWVLIQPPNDDAMCKELTSLLQRCGNRPRR